MPNATINSNTFARTTLTSEKEDVFIVKIFNTDIFKEGLNTISASVHQSNIKSTDCIFSLEVIAHDDPEILSIIIENSKTDNEDIEQQMIKLASKFEIDKVNIENKALENSNYILKIIIYIIVFLLIICLIFYYILINNFNKKTKNKKKLFN